MTPRFPNAKFPGGFGGVFFSLFLVDGFIDDYERWTRANANSRTLDEQMCDDYHDAGPFLYTSFGIIPNSYQGCKGA